MKSVRSFVVNELYELFATTSDISKDKVSLLINEACEHQVDEFRIF